MGHILHVEEHVERWDWSAHRTVGQECPLSMFLLGRVEEESALWQVYICLPLCKQRPKVHNRKLGMNCCWVVRKGTLRRNQWNSKCCVWTSFSWDLNQFHCIMFGISLCHLHLHNNLQVVREFCTYCLALTLEFLGSSLCWVAQRLSSFYGWGSWSSVKCTHMEGSRAAAWRMWGCHGVSTWSSEVLLRALCGHQVRTIYFLSVAHQVRTMYLFSVWLTKFTLSVYFLGVCSLCSLYVLWFLCGIMQLKI